MIVAAIISSIAFIIGCAILGRAIHKRNGALGRILDRNYGQPNKLEELIMGLREDFEALTAKFDGLESAVTAVAEDIAALKDEITEANERANIDLSPLIARAEGIEAGLRAAVGSGPGSDG